MNPFEIYLGYVHMWNLNCQRGGKIQIHTIPVLFFFGQPGSRSSVLVAVFPKERVRLEQTVCKAVYRCPRCTGGVDRERRISQPHSCCTVHMCSELHDRAGKMMSYSPLKKKIFTLIYAEMTLCKFTFYKHIYGFSGNTNWQSHRVQINCIVLYQRQFADMFWFVSICINSYLISSFCYRKKELQSDSLRLNYMQILYSYMEILRGREGLGILKLSKHPLPSPSTKQTIKITPQHFINMNSLKWSENIQ